MSHFEGYGALASNRDVSLIYQAGRLPAQIEAERLIVRDVTAKLRLAPTSRLLEIGCGPGNLMIPLSFAVEHATGIDHPAVIEMAEDRYQAPNVRWVGGEFPSVDLNGTFDRILVYSVLHILQDFDAVRCFIFAAMELLEPGGLMLLGDLASADRKARFLRTERGQAFDREWRRSNPPSPDKVGEAFDARNQSLGAFTDAQLAALFREVRERGFDCYVLPQPPDLPFGNTREDMLILRP